MKNKNKSLNHLWWIIPILLVLLFIIVYLIFSNLKNNNLDYKDWLAFLGAYLGFAGSVILGYVAVYQNKKLRDNSDKQYKNAIKPILNIVYRKIHLLKLVDIREIFHHFRCDEANTLEFTESIPRDIRSLHRDDFVLSNIVKDKRVSDEEYYRLDNIYNKNLSKLSRKYLLVDFYLDNNGNGNAINIELLINGNKLSISPSLQSGRFHACLLLIEVPIKQNSVELQLTLTYTNIDNEKFDKQEIIQIERDSDGQLVLKSK